MGQLKLDAVARQGKQTSLCLLAMPYKVVWPGCALFTLLAYLLWWHWIGQFPLQLTSDDALNFARGVERFSVLEFRPHFPGYPAFIGFARLAALWVAPNTAAIWVSLMSAMLIPLAVARLIYLCSLSLVAATFGGVLALTQPLLASMALSGLSDAPAILLLLVALVAAVQKQYWQVGLWLGLMLATRPSYVVLALGVAAVPWWQGLHRQQGFVGQTKAFLKASCSLALVGSVSLIFIWAHDGAAYITEGIRFTQGHFAIWGNTVEGNDATLWQWVSALREGFGGLLLWASLLSLSAAIAMGHIKSTCLMGLSRAVASPALAALATVAALYWVWISVGQNPDNLRHWAPVLFLALVVMSAQMARLVQGRPVLIVVVVGLISYHGGRNIDTMMPSLELEQTQLQAPIQQAIQWIRTQPQIKVVGTNYSVNLLRAQLQDRAVYDMFYPSSERALREQAHQVPNSAWRISGTQLSGLKLEAQFAPRFIGERRLFLYQISQ
ncbi:hypothetical protein [Photobacterium sanguinicancri]|uniref:hypothetical protein n=1 Tax=Photobacterium sanguinicancri TaxID=875932 RepID=UPI0021C4049C|nr:hypothetical protein [Photobacterium sanguinicancri]